MFKSLKNIQSAWQLSKTVTLATLVCSTLIVLVTLYHSQERIAKEREKIYVLDKGKSLILALSQDMAQNRPVEARNHVKMFHELFFTLSPDADAINANIRGALLLVDKSGYNYYNDLHEAGYYGRVISANVIQEIVVDSISVDYEYYPYSVVCHATQTIARQSNITTRSLVTTCELENCQRSDNNPHGFLMTGFKVTKNEDISTHKTH